MVLKKRVALHMKDNAPTIEGVLVKRTRSDYVLIAAEILAGPDQTHSLAGHVLVPRGNVYCVQEIQ